ncbi:MAG: hypothetical protein ACP5G4_09010 [bacterium]
MDQAFGRLFLQLKDFFFRLEDPCQLLKDFFLDLKDRFCDKKEIFLKKKDSAPFFKDPRHQKKDLKNSNLAPPARTTSHFQATIGHRAKEKAYPRPVLGISPIRPAKIRKIPRA